MFFEPQNVEQGMSNDEVAARATVFLQQSPQPVLNGRVRIAAGQVWNIQYPTRNLQVTRVVPPVNPGSFISRTRVCHLSHL